MGTGTVPGPPSPLKRWLRICSRMAAKFTNSSEESSMGSAVYFSRRVFTENLARGAASRLGGATPAAPTPQPWHTPGFSSGAKRFNSCWLPLPTAGRRRRAGLCLGDPPMSPGTPRGGRCSPLCKWPGRANKGPLPPGPCAGGDGFPFLRRSCSGHSDAEDTARQDRATPGRCLPGGGSPRLGGLWVCGDPHECGWRVSHPPVGSGGASWHSRGVLVEIHGVSMS